MGSMTASGLIMDNNHKETDLQITVYFSDYALMVVLNCKYC